ncbi:MAG TPA: hypothetical protein VL860_09820 [Planctomycetota bacterium]|nr:hypothetical protein [Planctomycetota bacterium]
MRRTEPHRPPARHEARPANRFGLWTSLAAACGALVLTGLTGCGEPSEDLQPADQGAHPVVKDQTRNAAAENQIAWMQEHQGHDEVLPIFPIGDDYRMLEVPNGDAGPGTATETNGKHLPLAFYIPASPDTVTGRAEKLNRLAAGVLYRDTSGPQPVYRLADFSRAKLGTQLALKSFNTYPTEKGATLSDDLKLTEGYPAIFSAAYIYRDLDMIERPKPAPAEGTKADPAAKPGDADSAGSSAARKVRIIRTDDMETFLKDNKADVLALLVVEVDEQQGQEHLVALWLWGRDPLTRGLFAPSACVQANKIDDRWPEATQSEMISLWHSLIDLERHLAAAKTVNVNLPHKTTP